MRALLLAVLAVLPAAAQEEDPAVLLGGRPAAGAFTRPAGAGPLEIGPSDPFPQAYDTVLLQGELPDPAVGFEASREENAAWGPWVGARLSRQPDGRFWAKAVFPGAGTGRLRVRAVGPRGPVPASVTLYSMSVFLSAPPQQGPVHPSSPEAAEPEPFPVVERQAWGAKPPKESYASHTPNRFTQHHTQGRRPLTLDQSLAEMRFLQDFHMNGRGWNDIGYHYLVDAEGRVFRGRPVQAVGAHVLNDNNGNVGVSFMGSHHPPANDPVTPVQLEASVRIGRWLQSRWGVTPETYKGHRDRGKTDCPGDLLYARLEDVRKAWRGAALGARLTEWWGSMKERLGR